MSFSINLVLRQIGGADPIPWLLFALQEAIEKKELVSEPLDGGPHQLTF